MQIDNQHAGKTKASSQAQKSLVRYAIHPADLFLQQRTPFEVSLPMAISLKCSCGKTLKVDEKHRGKKAKCPACGNTLLVEEQDADTAVQAEEPTKRRAAARDDDNGDEDEPEVRKPIKKKAAAKSNKMMYFIGGGCGLLLLLTCCVSGVSVGVWYFFFRGDDDDLKYVHEGVAG